MKLSAYSVTKLCLKVWQIPPLNYFTTRSAPWAIHLQDRNGVPNYLRSSTDGVFIGNWTFCRMNSKSNLKQRLKELRTVHVFI